MSRTGPIKRKTPLRSLTAIVRKPAKPRPPKKPVRRMKEKVGREPSAAEKRAHAAIREKGCEACGAEAEIHHILHAPETENQRCHWLVVALCPAHHRVPYPGSVHTLGREDAFDRLHGTDLLGSARRNRQLYFMREAAE